jgi:hypothetical protein
VVVEVVCGAGMDGGAAGGGGGAAAAAGGGGAGEGVDEAMHEEVIHRSRTEWNTLEPRWDQGISLEGVTFRRKAKDARLRLTLFSHIKPQKIPPPKKKVYSKVEGMRLERGCV